MADVVLETGVYVNVRMTYDEAVALAALSGYIVGANPDSYRGVVCDILNDIRSTLDDKDVRQVARNVKGSVRFCILRG